MLSRSRLGLLGAALLALAAWALLAYQVRRSPPETFRPLERSVFSAAGEDGVLETLFQAIPPRHRFLVDLGAGDGVQHSSSRNLLVNHGWRGLLVEPREPLASRLLANYEGNDRVTPLTSVGIDAGDIEIVLGRNGVPRDLDLLIIGLRANDWYVWRALSDFRPTVVQIQYNAAFVPPQTMVIEYHPSNYWDGSIYFGASIQSLYNLGKRKGYELVYAESSGTNLFFVEAGHYRRLGIRDNSPLAMYRPCPTLPRIFPATLWEWVDADGSPKAPSEKELPLPSARVPRQYVLGEF